MTNDLSTKTALVWDHGCFLPLARRLAQGFGRVLYHRPWAKSYPLLNEGIIGDGFGDLEHCLDPWLVKDEVDCFVFPDIYHRGEQKELREQGYPVWGAADGMLLEINRQYFLEQLATLNLDVPAYRKVIGLTALADYLKEREDIYIKCSFWRGSWETTHWRSWAQDGHKLDVWAVRFGGAKEHIHFLCFDQIDTQLEIGGDTYCVDGKWPSLMLHGIERKDQAYFSAVTLFDEMPQELTDIMASFGPLLNQVKYRCQWSMEVRVAESGNFFIDATTRGGLPSTASQLLLWDNFPEIIWGGANGVLIQPDPSAKFSAECMVKAKSDHAAWDTIVVPDELKPHLMLADCCEIDGQIWFPPDNEEPTDDIGWLCAIGDTPTEVARKMNELADALPDGAEACVEALADVIREIEAEEEKGIPFTDQKMPKPEIVLAP